MIRFIHEERTPKGGWTYVHPISGMTFNRAVIWVLRDVVKAHCKANGWELLEDDFRANVARNTPNAQVQNVAGLGDIVAAVAQPVAGAIDAVAAAVGVKTNVKGCGGCKKRRDRLNRLSEKVY